MLPVLLELGFVKIYTLGVFLVIAFFAASFWLWRNVKLTSYKEEEVFDGVFMSILGGLLVSRLVYVALHFEDFGFDILKFLLINGYPGLSLVGAIFGGVATIALYCRVKKISFMTIVDYMAGPLLLGLSIGKIGSLLGGVDVGRQTDFPLRVFYVGLDGARHVSALYEAILFAIGFAIAHKIIFKVRRERLERGASLYFFLIWFSLVQLMLDFTKQNHIYLAKLSLNMVISALVLVFTTAYLLIVYRKGAALVTTNFVQSMRKNAKNNTYENTTGNSEDTASER